MMAYYEGPSAFPPANLLPPEERRQIMQLVDAFIERGQLKRRASSNASN